jgi:hypothetical protein
LLRLVFNKLPNNGQLDLENAGFDECSWTVSDRSSYINNWGVGSDEFGNRLNVKNELVTTDYDDLFRVFESLLVGLDPPEAWERNDKVKWEKPRTVCSIVYPAGPNYPHSRGSEQGVPRNQKRRNSSPSSEHKELQKLIDSSLMSLIADK